MDELHLYAAALDTVPLLKYAENLRSVLDEKGTEYDGPMPLPTSDIGVRLEDVKDGKVGDWVDEFPGWFDRFALPEEEITNLIEYNDIDEDEYLTLYGRGFRIYNEGGIRAAMNTNRPSGVCVSAQMDSVTRHKSGNHVPSGYNPYDDHQPNPHD